MTGFRLGPHATARGYRLHAFGAVGSTSSEAAQAAQAGDPGLVWFAATRQTAGRGRRGRAWETPDGNLAASLLLVPTVEAEAAATLGFVAGVALCRALASLLPGGMVQVGVDGAGGKGSRIALKWPNDLVADGAKLAGILLEAQKRPDGGLAVVMGFGVNVVAAPQGLPYPATALSLLGSALTAADVFAALSDSWVAAYDVWDNGRGTGDILGLWRRSAAGIGAEVAVSQGGDTVQGIFETIDDSGRLIVRSRDDRRIAITAGDVHFGVTASIRN